MDTNDEFGLDEATIQEPTPLPLKAARGRKAAADAVNITAAPVEEIDPNKDRANWPVIMIEREKDRPNFEFLQVMGTYRDGSPLDYRSQVQRGVDVSVPPCVVHMLRNAKAAYYEQRKDPVTGIITLERSDRSATPWRLVHGGKYIQ